MTDRTNCLTVLLDTDIRSDDVEPIMELIRQIRHVSNVAYNVRDAASWQASEEAKFQLREQIWDLLKPF